MPHTVDEDFGVSVQALVPLHDLVMQSVDVQVIAVPRHAPPEQASLNVHGFESSHATAVRQAQVPPVLVQWYVVPPQLRVWQEVAALHVVEVPALHVPSARLAPHPEHALPVLRVVAPQVSAQAPAAVPQPVPLVHVTVQHSLPPPTAQVVVPAEHVQLLHTSPVPLQ